MGEASNFGQWLKGYRKVKDLTQDQLAYEVNLSPEMIRKIESGTRILSRETAEVLAKYVGVPEEGRSTFVRFARTGDALTEEEAAHVPFYAIKDKTAPKRQSERPPSKMPAQHTRFVGRAHEIALLTEMLLDNSTNMRLFTLTGPPGIGKSRLSVEVANRLLDTAPDVFSDGAFWVPLSPLTDHSTVLAAISQVLNVREAGDQGRVDPLKAFIGEKKMLLVLDNFEHVLPAARFVVELLGACPGLQVITSSRECLHVSGEQQFPVPPMQLPEPDSDESLDLESISQCEAVEWFVQRATAAKPDFKLNEQNFSAVVQICRTLDALPLAIELAAARVKMLPPQELLGWLDSSMSLLTTNATDLSERQQTLRGAIEWSYKPLSEQEKGALRRLGVFVGGWSIEAAGAILQETGEGGSEFRERPATGRAWLPGGNGNGANAGFWPTNGNGNGYGPGPGIGMNGNGRSNGHPSIGVFDILDSLVEKSLIRPMEVGGESRYTMLWTIREYSLERLAESGEESLARRQHARYFLDLAQTAEPGLTSADRGHWLKRLDREHYNMLEALEWSCSEEGDAEIGLRLAGALGWYWYFGGYLSEGYYWLKRVLDLPASGLATATRAKALVGIGRLSVRMSNFTVAEPWLEEGVAISKQTGDKERLAYGQCLLGLILVRRGEHKAISLCEESLSLFEELGNKWTLADAAGYVADATSWVEDREREANLMSRSLALYREVGDDWGVAEALLSLAVLDYATGNYDRAIQRNEEALTLDLKNGDKWNTAFTYYHLARSLHSTGIHDRARYTYEEAYRLFRELGIKRGAAGASRYMGYLAQARGDLKAARDYFSQALYLTRGDDDTHTVLMSVAAAGGFLNEQGARKEAIVLFSAVQVLGGEDMLTRFMPLDQTYYRAQLSNLGTSLEAEQSDATWKQGGSPSLEEVVDFALSTLAGW